MAKAHLWIALELGRAPKVEYWLCHLRTELSAAVVHSLAASSELSRAAEKLRTLRPSRGRQALMPPAAPFVEGVPVASWETPDWTPSFAPFWHHVLRNCSSGHTADADQT
mgnify:CR=1 FL=1